MTEAYRAPGAVVWVEGPDASTFLQGLLSNDVAAVPVGHSAPALLLDARGRIRVMLLAARTGDEAFTLLTEAALGQRLADLLDEYHFSEDVDIFGPEPVETLTVRTDAPPTGAELTLAGWIAGTVVVMGDMDALISANDLTVVSDQAFTAWRVSGGIPTLGVDITERTLVHEAGLAHSAVSFDKGCYLGQETVARVEYRGGVNRRLVGVTLPRPVSPGATVMLGEREVGVLTSTAEHPRLGAIGLAVLRKEAEDGVTVTIGSDQGTVTPLPFDGATRSGPAPIRD